MLQKLKSRIAHRGALLIFFLIYCGFGCSQIQKFPGFETKGGRYDADKATLQRGNRAFHNGDYQKALEIFRMLSQLAENEKTSRMALYGLACTRLILSENTKDLDEAIILWDAWSQLVPPEMVDEDPRMLKPLLPGMAFPEKIKKKMSAWKKIDKNEADSEILKARDNKILQLQKQLKTMENEVETLRHQISSLEEIDQNIFEKKKDISTDSH